MDLMKFAKKNRVDVILVLALFFLAFGIRSIPSDRFPDIYGFDSFWAARMSKYIITGEQSFPFQDYTVDYPYGRYVQAAQPGWWYLNVGVYNIAALFTGTSGFDAGLFGSMTSWLNALVGALAIPAVYLFGRKAFNRWTGLFSALFLAASTSHLFYSIFGHAENDALGFTLFFLGLFAFVAAVKERSRNYLILTAFVASWLALTWQSYNVLVILTAGTVFIYFLLAAILKPFGYYKDSEQRTEKRKWMLYALLALLVSAIAPLLIVGKSLEATSVSVISGAVLGSCIIEYLSMKEKPKITSPLDSKVHFTVRAGSIAAAVLVIGFIIYGGAMVSAPLKAIGMGPEKDMPDYQARMLTTIAEQNPIPGKTFLDRINFLASSEMGIVIWLALLVVILMFAKLFIMPFIRKDFYYEWDMLALGFVFISMWMLTERAQTTFFLAGAVCFGAGYLIAQLIRVTELIKLPSKTRMYTKTGVFMLFILMFFSFNMLVVSNAETISYDVYPEWQEVFKFLNSNAVPEGSVVTAWWDYGHWMAYYNGDKIHLSLDNIQDRPDIIYTIASAFTNTPQCSQSQTGEITCDTSEQALETAEVEALSILKPLKTNYIIIDQEIIGGAAGGKFTALEKIANTYIGCMQTLDCYEDEDVMQCPIGKDESGKPVALKFPTSTWASLETVEWPGMNLNSYGLPTRAFARTDSSGKHIYMSALACGQELSMDQNSPVLYGFAHRLFFKDPNLKHVKLVYEDGWNVIYEVDWAGIPDPEDYTSWTSRHAVLPAVNE